MWYLVVAVFLFNHGPVTPNMKPDDVLIVKHETKSNLTCQVEGQKFVEGLVKYLSKKGKYITVHGKKYDLNKVKVGLKCENWA